MNFFFHCSNNKFESSLVIPKFSNAGVFAKDVFLFEAEVVNNCWSVSELECKENDKFWNISCKRNEDHQKIFFLAKKNEASLISKENKLIDINSFTDTIPDFRANLKLKNNLGGFSSYQSEYPYKMATKLTSLMTDCGLLTSSSCRTVGVFIKNIFVEPVKIEVPIYLYSNIKNKVLDVFSVCLNETRYIDLTPHKTDLTGCFLYAKNFIGIPIYVVEYIDGNMSMEHTHPPHESIGGPLRFDLVTGLKNEAELKIFEN